MKGDGEGQGGGSPEEATRLLGDLVELHREIDAEVEALAALHAERLQCRRGCAGCCVDDLTVSPIEAERIKRGHPDLLASGKPHAKGACAFLDAEGACRVYADRPSVCRSQGLPLRFFFEDETGEIEERRDICPLNQPGGPAVETLDESACWLIGPHEHRIGMLDEAFAEARPSLSAARASAAGPGRQMAAAPPGRIALRSLFARGD